VSDSRSKTTDHSGATVPDLHRLPSATRVFTIRPLAALSIERLVVEGRVKPLLLSGMRSLPCGRAQLVTLLTFRRWGMLIFKLRNNWEDSTVRLTCAAALAILAMGGSARCQEVVTNEPLTKKQLIATLPLLTLPKLDVDKIITATNDKDSNTWMVSIPAAVSSVLVSEQLPKELKQAVNSIPTRDWADIETWQPNQKKAMATAVEHWKAKYLADERKNHFDSIFPVTAVNNTEFKEGLQIILPRAKETEKEKITR
jgi:hypothetical protein